MSVEEAGERGLWLCTSERFGKEGKGGMFRLNAVDEEAGRSEVLEGYRKDGSVRKVSVETVRVWERALGVDC